MESFGGADSFSALPAVARCAAPPPAPAPLLPRAPAWLKRPVGSKFCVSTTVMRLQLQHHGVVRRRGLVQRAAGRGALCRAAARARPAAAARARLAQEARGLQVLALPAVARCAAPPPAPAPLLPRAPAWLKRPVGSKFCFGGKLVTFEKCPQEAGPQKLVHISQVISEPEIVERATELDAVLETSLSHDPAATERLAEYCRQKGDATTDQNERYTWFFLRANFLPTFRSEVLNLLGFKQDEMSSKFKSANIPAGDGTQPDVAALSRGESTETEAELSTDTSTDLSDAHTQIERKLANLDLTPNISNVVIPNGEDSTSLICRALVCGHLEEAVELCLDAKRIADALIIASLGSPELLYKVQKYHINTTAGEPVSLVCGSLLLARWDTLVMSAAPSSWRDTLAALLTHCEGDTASHYCEMLGDKLSKESDPALSEAATICYLCAMSPEELVARWSRSRRADVSALAALTELALLARRAALARGRQVPAGGKLETVLNEYASRLASQGCLQSALNTLEGIQHTELRDRLMHALGLIQQRRASHQPQQQQPRHSVGHVQPHRRTHLSHTEPSYAPTVPGYSEPWPQSSVPAPSSTLQQQRPGYSQPQALQPQPPQLMQPAALPPQTTQPPRPGSVGPTGLGSRSKYKVDPSVQSAPLYNQYSFNNPVTSQPYGGFNSPLPDQYGGASVPAYGQGVMNPAPMNQGQMNQIHGPPGQMSVNPAQLNQPGLNPTVNGSYYNPAQAPEPAAPALPSKPVPPGWNDPPMMSSKPKPKQEVSAQAPITHPLFGVEPPQHVPLAPTSQYGGQQFPQQFGQAAPQYGQQYPNQYPDYQAAAMTPAYPQKPESPAPVEPAAPVQKAPLPEQHVILQSVFDAIRAECSNRATNPQMKRKLEDVQRRLETLYDMLREYKLSETACASLHSCCAYAQSGNHGAALAVATSLAGGADFAAVASFLPGLKMLCQLAQQLGVYAR
ncbi:hypothetical protein PYW07_005456 [Mythimna separata]|uniref:Sec16 Sec23-binding domain-containing protein n=1 Tax=Mythimna separata TaxID=271217 RepID=A0AAD8DPY8_MYTSE|nr:hypothetical protein PYW07_005456 [Mythimna separata]